MNFVVVAEKSFEVEKEAHDLYKELLRLGMVVRLVEEKCVCSEMFELCGRR